MVHLRRARYRTWKSVGVPKKSEVVAQAIVHDIVVRGFQPGDRLASEAEMMEQYDVGRGSLREALRVLELNGLVSLKPGPGGGPVVESVNPTVLGRMLTLYLHVEGATYRELVAARLAVEPTCAALAAATASAEAKQRLADLGTRAHELDFGDDAAYRAMSHDFHGAVASMSGNRILELLAHALMAIFDGHVARATRDIDTRAAAPDEHDAVIAAIVAGDAAAAESQMRTHMEHYAEVFGQALPELLDETVRWE
jgi:DNA-binding FadR family transcriptional regulator